MENNPLISIIVPVYNTEYSLQKCIDSILSQTYVNYEVILVNDGSKDQSFRICKEYEERYKNITVINQENQGVSVARNNGIGVAKGKYLTFIDSDDWIGKNYLSGFKFLEYSTDLYVEGIDYYVTHRKQHLNMFKYKESILNIGDHDAVFKHGLPQNGCPVAKLFLREIIIKYNLKFNKEFAINEDHLFVTEYISKIKSAYLSPAIEYFYLYDISKKSLTKSNHTPDTYLKIARALDSAYNNAYRYESTSNKDVKIAKYIYGPQQILNAMFAAEADNTWKEYFNKCKKLWIECNFNNKIIFAPDRSRRLLSKILDSESPDYIKRLECLIIIRYSKILFYIKDKLNRLIFR